MVSGLVRLRLARFGRTHSPAYNIVVARATKARDAKPIEVVGTYKPIPRALPHRAIRKGVLPEKEVELDFTRVQYWIGVGAQPTDTVARLLVKAGILDTQWLSGKQQAGLATKPVVEPRKEVLE